MCGFGYQTVTADCRRSTEQHKCVCFICVSFSVWEWKRGIAKRPPASICMKWPQLSGSTRCYNDNPFPLSAQRERQREGWGNKRKNEWAKKADKEKRKVKQIQKERKRKMEERKWEERKRGGKDEKEKRKKRLAWSTKQEVWGPSAMSACLSHFTHTQTHTALLPRWSCSLCHSGSLKQATSYTLISPLFSCRIIRTKVQQQPGQAGSVSAHSLGTFLQQILAPLAVRCRLRW